MTEYNYTDSDFVAATNGVDVVSFQDSVWTNATITTLFLGLKVGKPKTGDATYTLVFDSAISGAEKTELDSLVAVHTGVPSAPSPLDVEKSLAKKSIDVAAGEARARYITVAPGQDAVYIEKEIEAKAHKDASYPADLTPYPFIAAEANAQGVSGQVASDTIIATADAWKGLAASIEELRLDYKNQVSAETDQNNVKALCCKAIALLNSI